MNVCVCVCSAGPSVSPSVSLLSPSSLLISGDSSALLCLLSSYSPQGATVSWTLDGSEVTEGVQTSAESERDGLYSRSSVLSLSKARWEDAERFVCRGTHAGAAHEASFLKSSECWCFSSEDQRIWASRDLQLNTEAVCQCAAIAVHSIKLHLNASAHLCWTASLISVSFLQSPALKFQRLLIDWN